MSFLISLIPTLIVLGILIIIHEFGHFLACRLCRVKVEKFSVGFGPEILRWQGKETRYAISLFPIGGFVKPAGESVSEVDSKVGPKPGDYLAAPLLARIFIVCAGVLMNYLLAYVLFVAIFVIGRPVPGTTIGNFVAGYPAQQSALEIGDKIRAVNGRTVRTWIEMMDAFDETPGEEFLLEVDRGGELLTLGVRPRIETVKDFFGKSYTVKKIGITHHPAAVEVEKFGLVRSLKEALRTEVFLTLSTYKGIFLLILGKVSIKTMAGPIGIIALTGDAARQGFSYLLQLMAVLSVSLAVINSIPIPALDGGHLLFLLIEVVRRKKVSLELQERATQVGFALLLGLMGFILYNDLVNLNIVGKVKEMF